MEIKSQKKYFTQTKAILYAGIGVILAGIIIYLLNRYVIEGTWQLYQLSILVMVAGVVCIICHFTIKVKDSSVDEYANTFVKYLEQQRDEFIAGTEKHVKYNVVYSYATGGYRLEGNKQKYLVFGSDNTPRCEEFNGGAIAYTPETLYVVTGSLNLIDGEMSTCKFAIPVGELKQMTLTDKSYGAKVGKNSRFVEVFVAEILSESATVAFTVHSDAMTDDAINKVNRMIESKKG